MFVLGSYAFDFGRKPNDIDLLMTEAELQAFKEALGQRLVLSEDTKFGVVLFVVGNMPIEIHLAEKKVSSRLLYNQLKPLARISSDIKDVPTTARLIPPDYSLMLKMSHRFLRNSRHFHKTRRDILFLERQGYTLPSFAKTWLPIRESETYDYSHPSLNQNKEDFFRDDFYVYDHDTIHEAVALYGTPAYQKIKTGEVKVSRELFERQSFDIQLATVYEESATLSLERWMIPNDMKSDPVTGFKIALSKVCTSIASGWWREFAWRHYDDVIALYESLGTTKYVEDFERAKQNGILKPWKLSA